MHISNYHKQIQILCQLLVRDYKEEACSGQSMGDTLSGQSVSKEGEEEDERWGPRVNSGQVVSDLVTGFALR